MNRIWNLVIHEEILPFPNKAADHEPVRELQHVTHKTIKKVTEDMEKFHFNTMLASLMEFTNYLSKIFEANAVDKSSWNQAIDILLLLLAPTAPHMTEELWTKTGHPYSIHRQTFPKWDEHLAAEDQVTLIVQINGKVRDKVTVPVFITEADAREIATSQPRVQAHLEGKEIAKVIYVPQRLINIVLQ